MFVLMTGTAIARPDRELQMLEAMVDCAHGLGMGFGRAAQAEADPTKSFQLFDAFHRSFLAVRLGIRLCMTLRAPPKPARADVAEAPERDPSETERLEREPAEGLERERDRDYEPVSLPKFLATLGAVAADAARLPVPADLRAGAATLQDLLARAKADAATPSAPAERRAGGVDLLTRPPPTATRAALLGSASATLARPVTLSGLPRPPPRRSG
jgi:hypothetical protein